MHDYKPGNPSMPILVLFIDALPFETPGVHEHRATSDRTNCLGRTAVGSNRLPD